MGKVQKKGTDLDCMKIGYDLFCDVVENTFEKHGQTLCFFLRSVPILSVLETESGAGCSGIICL